ncbi:PREDICTED: uncharacterized protein LOC104767686 [Camelina sativa]|uniref:Uncharacterized protein LOC104767686 n=1 Tax=Camelina sativa TaxID=90675 RepID=A0ABM0XRR2_CAMSA|nr:PREDICTED: uncharacterized protein LOC104767686 [Camelina sativa]
MMMSNLPDDLVEEILSTVSLTSTRAMRSTCKKWNALTKDQSFTDKHIRMNVVAASGEREFLMIKFDKAYLIGVNLISKPLVDHPSHGSWSCCNDMVSTWLMNSVSKKIGASLLYISTAEGIWKNLLPRFKQDDAPRVYEIEQRLTCIQQGSLDVSAYYTELVTLWEEYKNYIELPVCTSGRCECNAAVLWERLQDRSRVTKFLMGLNESYEQTRRHILMLKPIPNMEEAYNMVTQDERQHIVSLKPPVKSDNVAFQTTGSYEGDPANGSYVVEPYEYVAAYNTYRPKSNRPMCTHCGKMGHMIQTCFKVHGYPHGFKYLNENNPGQGQNTQRPSFVHRGQANQNNQGQFYNQGQSTNQSFGPRSGTT